MKQNLKKPKWGVKTEWVPVDELPPTPSAVKEIAIDLDASAEFQSTEQPANPETVVSNLLTVQNSVTLVGLTVGEGAEAQVEMTTGEWMLELIDAGGGDGLQSGRVSGRALVVLEEVL